MNFDERMPFIMAFAACGDVMIIGMLNVFLAVASVSTNPGQMTCNLILFCRHIKYKDSANDMLADLVGP